MEIWGKATAAAYAGGLVAGAQKAEPKVAAFRETEAYASLTEYERAAMDTIWRTLWNITWSRRLIDAGGPAGAAIVT